MKKFTYWVYVVNSAGELTDSFKDFVIASDQITARNKINELYPNNSIYRAVLNKVETYEIDKI